MAQTTYALSASTALAGQDGPDAHEKPQKLSRIALGAIPFGRLVETASGEVRIPNQTTLGTLVGASCYKAAKTPDSGGYADDEMTLVMRKGQIWVEYGGTAPTAMTVPNIMHSSTVSTHRGKVTATATSAGAGTEITAGPEGMVVLEVDTTLGLALVELNFPA